jgi:hypothetical protein
MNAEGWYQDPFGRHAERWISDGRPTGLVRDAGVETHDPPPSDTAPGPLLRAAEKPAHSDDMLRAGEVGGGVDGDTESEIAQAVLDHGVVGPDFSP